MRKRSSPSLPPCATWRATCASAGHRVRYVAIDDASNRQSDARQPGRHHGALRRAHGWSTSTPTSGGSTRNFAPVVRRASPLPRRPWAASISTPPAARWPRCLQRPQAVAHGALLPPHAPAPAWRADRYEAGEPEGGQWNYDHDNRKPWPGTPVPRRPMRGPTHDHSALWATIVAAGVQSFGNPQAACSCAGR